MLTRMLHARATSANGQMFAVYRDDHNDRADLQWLEALGMVSCHSGWDDDAAVSLWHLTPNGMHCLEPCRILSHPSPALADRGCQAIEDRTTLELFIVLELEGCTGVHA